MNIKRLKYTAPYEKAVVSDLTAVGTERHCILDIDLSKGASTEALRKSPTGDPTAYFITGAVITIHRYNARNVQRLIHLRKKETLHLKWALLTMAIPNSIGFPLLFLAASFGRILFYTISTFPKTPGFQMRWYLA